LLKSHSPPRKKRGKFYPPKLLGGERVGGLFSDEKREFLDEDLVDGM